MASGDPLRHTYRASVPKKRKINNVGEQMEVNRAAVDVARRSGTLPSQRSSGSTGALRTSGGGTGAYGGGAAGGGGSYGGGSYGGGSYGGGGASIDAEQERRREAAQKLVRELYAKQLWEATALRNQQRGQIDKWQDEVLRAVPMYRQQALNRIGDVYGQNQAETQAFDRQIRGQGQRALSGLDDQQAILEQDLAGQGAAASGLQAAHGQYAGDVRGAQGAGQDYNRRLAQVMATSNADYRNMANSVAQASTSQARLQRQAAMNQLAQQYAQNRQGLDQWKVQAMSNLV